MSRINYCANCEAQDRPTHYEGGTVCRTCCLFTDLHVATHYIRTRQPSMLTVLDGALSDARTLAHRIMDYDNQKSTAAGIPNEHQLQDWDGRNRVPSGHGQGKMPFGCTAAKRSLATSYCRPRSSATQRLPRPAEKFWKQRLRARGHNQPTKFLGGSKNQPLPTQTWGSNH